MNRFSAQEQSLGYHYQIRYALYLLLSSKNKDDLFIKLEKLDDVEIGDLNLNRLDLHQTKFHIKKAANLTDSGVDIWKTIRVWSQLVINNSIDLDNVLLVLVTTSVISQDSILNKLTENKTDRSSIQDVINKLNKVSKESKNQELKEAFKVYNELTDVQKEKLIKSIHIRDKALDLDNLKKQIQSELQLCFLPNQLELAFNDLQGWWYEQCIKHLKNEKTEISYQETQDYFRYILNKYKEDNLPIDYTIMDKEVGETDFVEMCFVKQLQEINLGRNAIGQSKRDYYQAIEQRSKWIREQLLNPQEEIDYETRLKEDWRSKFAYLKDDIEDDPEEIIKEKCKQFYTKNYGNSDRNIPIRPKVIDVFIFKGSCQMLADNQDIAWHPKYLKS